MAAIELTDVLCYKGGVSGASLVVGQDYENGAVVSRVARYSFTAPAEGANRVRLTFHISGVGDGAAIPLRFFIGTAAESHANAGPDSEYTGELTLAEDWLSLTGEAELLLLPGRTYYLWVFPGSETYGWYTWQRSGYTSALEPSGAACVVYVVQDGALYLGLGYVVREGAWWLGGGYVVQDGSWYLCSAVA